MAKYDKPKPPPDTTAQKPFPPPMNEAQIEAFLAQLPQDQLMVALAKAQAIAKGLEDDDAKAYVDAVSSQLQALAKQVDTADAERREQIAQAFANVDRAKLDESLRLLTDYIQQPTPEKQQRTQTVLADLEKVFGPLLHDPAAEAREDQARRERIRAEVRENVSQIFAQLPKPDLSFKPTTKLPGADDDEKK